MEKTTGKPLNDLSLNADDVLDDIAPEDYVFVISQEGILKGISLPEVEIEDNDKIEEILKFFINREGGSLLSRTVH